MERRVNFILIGGIFFILLVLFVAFILWFGRLTLGDNNMKEYIVLTDFDVSALSSKTPIKYKGINVGSIKDIEFENRQTGLIRIVVEIHKDIPVHVGSSLMSDSQGLAGLTYLSLKQNLKEKLIETKEESYLILEKNFMGKIADQADELAQSLIKVVGNQENIDNFNKLMNSLTLFSVKLNSISEALDSKLKDGQYDVKDIILPTLIQLEKSLNTLDIFLQKGIITLDNFNENPYKTLFGEAQKKDKK